ncbi:MAG: phytoene desaturase family protein [Balneolaceae bacterium]|nr:phytoene desaturase family protein [Balneolaceae bacterium]
MKIGIIGAGLGGLAVSSLLASDGHEVAVFEKNASAGGKMNEIRSGGYRFDTGPSLLTMPHLLEELFAACGRDIAEYLQMSPLEPLCRYFFEDGTRFDNFSDRDRSMEAIAGIAPGEEEAYQRFLDYSKELYCKTATAFLYNPLYDFGDLKNTHPNDFWGIDAFATVSRRVDETFSSPYLRQFFKRFTTYNGSSPYQAPATLNVIPHVEIACGGYYVDGGIYRVAEALCRLAESSGVSFHMNADVTHINTESGTVTGIRLDDGKEYPFDIVVSNADAYETYLRLLPEESVGFLRKTILSRTEPSCSGFVLLLGIDRTYDQLRHHNVFFSNDYRTEFRRIFRDRRPPENPTIYVANTSSVNPAHATEGGSNLFVLVNAPYLSDRFNWEERGREYGERIKKELERRGLAGLRETIQFEKQITPRDFYRLYRSNSGSIYGTSSNSRLSAFVRPGNRSRSVNGLYLVGGSTHPGGGIPLVILSAMHARELIGRYESR